MISPLDKLIHTIAKLPGLGPRSARRIVLHLLKRREATLAPLIETLSQAAAHTVTCAACGNLDMTDPCRVCADPRRDAHVICVVEDVADLWALERSGAFRGQYHILGGTLSALDGVRPEDLRLASLLRRVEDNEVREVILALNATVEGQTTAHYVAERLAESGVTITRLSHGLPIGGELDYLDDGTLMAALQARRSAA